MTSIFSSKLDCIVLVNVGRAAHPETLVGLHRDEMLLVLHVAPGSRASYDLFGTGLHHKIRFIFKDCRSIISNFSSSF
jgi:hypothetical protein